MKTKKRLLYSAVLIFDIIGIIAMLIDKSYFFAALLIICLPLIYVNIRKGGTGN